MVKMYAEKLRTAQSLTLLTMADKELTVFVVDLHPLTAIGGLEYVFDVLAGKLLKGLKTDYVSMVALHAPETHHELAEKGVFKGVHVITDFQTPAYDQLQRMRQLLVPNAAWKNEADAFQAMIFAVSLFQPTKGKQFTRNIVVVTSVELPLSSYTPEKALAIPGLLKDLNVNLVVIGAENDSWRDIAAQFASSTLLSPEEAVNVARSTPPLKKTRPLPVYKGELRLGADASKVLRDKGYRADDDDTCLTWNVEVYPAAKSEMSALGGHDYIVDNTPVRAERKTRHYVWEKNPEYNTREEFPEEDEVDDKKYDKLDVETSTFTPGFKFSNFDLIALDQDLMDAAKLKFSSAFDVVGFWETDNIPYAYFTDEALFVVPEKASSARNLLNHNAFSEALYELGVSPIVRFVKKLEKEIELGAMVPVRVQNGETYATCFIYIRFPFKEDEKIGNFPSLTDTKQDEKSGDLNAMDSLMEEFIESKSFVDPSKDDTTEYKSVVDNYKVTLKASDSSKLPLPTKFMGDEFLSAAPGANKFNVYLRRILVKSLTDDEKSLRNPKFIEENIRTGAGFTNFFNLSNCMEVSSALDQLWLTGLNKKSVGPAKRLVDALDVKYVRKADMKKQKASEKSNILQAKGNYGADEGEYDVVPDFDF